MKKIIIFFAAILTWVVIIPSCDIVEEPYLKPAGTSDNGQRKVLLEDFTGQKCPNCPGAAELAKNLQFIYGKQLVVIAMHAGFYAEPSASFPADYRTPEGDALNASFDIQGYPSGLVDRTKYQGNVVLFQNFWEDAVAQQIALPAQAWIEITTDYQPDTRTLSCTLKTEFLEDLEGTYNICVVITESGIVSPQQSGSGIIEDYEHNHLLRASLNGTWGSLVGTTGQAVAGIIHNNAFSITLDAGWNADHCHVVAYVYNTVTREVLQAEETEIK